MAPRGRHGRRRRGIQLYIDGALVTARTDLTYARTGYYGYWRIGGGALNGFPSTNTGTGRWFDGSIDEVALYKKVLTPLEIGGHYAASGRNAPNFLAHRGVHVVGGRRRRPDRQLRRQQLVRS